MPPLDLDFAPRPRLRAAGVALLAAAAVVTAGVGAWDSTVRSEIAALEQRKAGYTRSARRAPAVPVSNRAAGADRDQEVRAARRVIGQMTVPWDELFRQLEAANDRSVALLGVHPDANGGQVLINGEAKSLQAILAYTRRLERTGVLRSVVVLGHTMKAERPGRAVEFSVSAAWQPQR